MADFKRRINLTLYAATYGYVLDRRSSSRNSAVKTHPAGDKIVVAKKEDGHWVYFSVRDPSDHGSIIDFVQRRDGGTLAEVRAMLRPWAGGDLPTGIVQPARESFAAQLESIPKNLLAVRVQYEAMEAWVR